MARKQSLPANIPWLLDLVVSEISRGIESCTGAVNGVFGFLADQATNSPQGVDAWNAYYTNEWILVKDLATGVGLSEKQWSAVEDLISNLQCGALTPELAPFYLAMLLPSSATGSQPDGARASTVARAFEKIQGIRDNVVGAIKDEMIPGLMQTRATAFLLHVAMPCGILHSKTPRQLLCEAVDLDNPNWGSLEDLFRLDRRIIYHPAVKEFLQRIDIIPEDAWLIIGNALSAGRRSLTATQITIYLARVVKDLVALFGISFSDKDVKQAFDDAARKEGKTCQIHWPLSLDAARKAISRAKPFSGLPPAVDKQTLEAVRTLCDRFS